MVDKWKMDTMNNAIDNSSKLWYHTSMKDLKDLIKYIKSDNMRIQILITYICTIPLLIGFILNNDKIVLITLIILLISTVFSLMEYILLMKNNPEVKQERK
jgi:hypothetical protein